VRLPVCYWPFDDATAGSATVADVVGGLSATLGSGAKPVPGLVGPGALQFDNTHSAEATIAGGTGDQVGTGLLAMVEGVTLEAVIVSAWSGRFGDYDEIYRKEDGDARVLLSFQNDGTNFGEYTEPAVPAGPCLSFGLHLAGRGYRELDMPLDGRDGRPTLAEITDGKPHHVVATYDSFTGRKAIFIDGRLRFSHDYPVGTMVLSGGPVAATIGSNHGHGEPFTGVIDELALYDFALTPAEIAGHWRRTASGENYFGTEPPAPGGPRWQAVTRLVEGQSRVFNQASDIQPRTVFMDVDWLYSLPYATEALRRHKASLAARGVQMGINLVEAGLGEQEELVYDGNTLTRRADPNMPPNVLYENTLVAIMEYLRGIGIYEPGMQIRVGSWSRRPAETGAEVDETRPGSLAHAANRIMGTPP